MIQDQWPGSVPFDPGGEPLPAELEALWQRQVTEGRAIVLAVGEMAHRDGWALRAAVALASVWAERGTPLILADLALDAPALHIELGVDEGEGVVDIFQFGSSWRRTARPVPGHEFRFLPAGAYIADPAEILGSPGWSHILRQLAEDGTTLLAYLPMQLEGSDDLVRLVGESIILADPAESSALVDRLTASAEIGIVLSSPVVEREVEEADTTMSADDTALPDAEVDVAFKLSDARDGDIEPSGEPLEEPPLLPRRVRRRRRSLPATFRLLLLLVLALVTWVLLDDRGLLPEWAAVPGWLGNVNPRISTTTSAVGTIPARDIDPADNEAEDVANESAVPVASPIPYSVAVEAHQDFTTASDRVAFLRQSEPDVGFFLTPIPDQGTVYYRILAGPVADTTAAWALMHRLVAARHKTDLDPWSIRPTVWAFHLGDFESEEAAEARAEELLRDEISTYLVEVEYSSGPPRYRLLAGAYEGPAPAEIMAESLRQAGIEAPLVRREGRPRR